MQVTALIYARISKDRTGAGLGVERQIADCQAFARERGWTVAATYRDDDISAYSGKPRPGYDALLRAIEAGEADVVLCWHQDRLLRRMADLERYITVCEPRGVSTHTVRAGSTDLATPAGRAIARTLGAWASYEVETSTARVKAAKAQAAKAGLWSGGQRQYGYEPGRTAIREPEAAVVRELAERVTGGESFRSCALDLNRRGVTTQHGKAWNALKVRNLLTRQSYAGIRQHHEAEYEGTWPALFSRTEWEQLQAAIRLHARQYKQHGPARKFLLTGFVVCGRCGNRLHTGPKQSGQSSYRCTKIGHEGQEIGCGKLTRLVDPVDQLVTEAILYRLDTDNLAAVLHEQNSTDETLRGLLTERDTRKQRLDDLVDDYASGLLTRSQLATAKATAEAALVEVERALERQTRSQASVNLLPIGQSVREAWEKNDLHWRRQLVALLVERVVIHPSPGVGNMRNADRWRGFRFRPSDVSIEWKC